ncbi:hypothetical protein PTMSG1_07596 [Pyrenophora teres f. maculata]|nr:hypothetical protein PTMSG1_07596 [Pyrenophora teres f. maculata]
MDNYRHISAGSQYDFDTSMGSDYEPQDIIYPEWQYPQNQLHQSMDFGRIAPDNYEQYPHQWPANKLEHQSIKSTVFQLQYLLYSPKKLNIVFHLNVVEYFEYPTRFAADIYQPPAGQCAVNSDLLQSDGSKRSRLTAYK